MYASNSLKKYNGYKALKILEVISILRFKKTVSGFTKNIRCINCEMFQWEMLQPCPPHKYTFQTC